MTNGKRPTSQTGSEVLKPPNTAGLDISENSPPGAPIMSSEVWKLCAVGREKLISHARIRLARHSERAEDLVQSILTDAADGVFDSVKVAKENILPFLKGVIRNRALRESRAIESRARRLVTLESAAPRLLASDHCPFREARKARLRRDLARALRKLPKAQRRAVVWKDLQGRSTVEIAACDEISEAAARQRLARGRAKLMRWLNSWKSRH